MKIKILTFIQLTTLLLVLSCGKETLQDTASRQLDLNHATSMALTRQYNVIQGLYSTNNTLDKSPYNIVMNLKATSVYSNGSSSPIPAIVGVILVSDKNNKQALPTKFSFNKGVYDESTGKLAIEVSGINTDGIQISCSTTNTSMLYCSWLPSAGGAEQFDVVLEKQQAN